MLLRRGLAGGWAGVWQGGFRGMAGLRVHMITWVVVPQCIVHIEPSAFLNMPAGFGQVY